MFFYYNLFTVIWANHVRLLHIPKLKLFQNKFEFRYDPSEISNILFIPFYIKKYE